MTVVQMMTYDQRKQFYKWGIKARYYDLMGHIFSSVKYINKAIMCYDRRWNLMMQILHEHGY